ncbi:MAG: VanZ family protein [Clostridia bacterium]|nr:VanZ family protein [Clostridia bacterium]
MKKKIVLSCVLSVLIAAMLVFIFVMSAKTADESNRISRSVGYRIGETFKKDFDTMTESERIDYAESIDRPVRKSAHFLEFLILGALLYADLRVIGAGKSQSVVPALSAGVFFAALDEFHQLFVPERAGLWSDVMIDSAGVVFGCAASFLLFLIVSALKPKKKNADN